MQKELSQKDGDALVAEAKAALAREEEHIEPDLALLATADFEDLAPTTTQRGEETVRAVQAALLADTGCPNLTDAEMQQMVLDGISDMQLGEHLSIQGHKVRLRGYNKVSAALAGGPQEGFAEFLGQMFCYKSIITGSSATRESLVDDEDNTAPRSRASSPAARSTTSTKDIPDFCELSECKIVYPTSADTITMSGVPAEFLSPRADNGYYGCLYGDCDVKISGKPAASSHVRRKHLGIALGCKICHRRYYKPTGWHDHMKAKHADVPRAQWFADPEVDERPKKLEESETRAAAASLAEALAARIHPDSVNPKPEPETEAAAEEGTTTDSDCMIVEGPLPKKSKH